MAFDITNFFPVSAGNQTGANRLWWYNTTGDTLATVKASAYFNSATNFLNQNDVIFVKTSDDKTMLEVTSASQAATVTTLEYTGTTASVTLAEGNMLVGNASGVGVALDVSAGGNIAIGNDTTMVALDGSGDGKILVGNGTTMTSVAVSGDGTMDNAGAFTIAAGAVEQSMIAANSLTGLVAGNVADANVIGGIPVLFRIDTAGGATADTDVTVTHKVRVIDAWVVNRAAGTASDTITIKNGSTAISDAIDISGADKTVARIGTIDDAQWEIAAAGTLRITETDGAGSDSPATTVFVQALRVA